MTYEIRSKSYCCKQETLGNITNYDFALCTKYSVLTQ